MSKHPSTLEKLQQATGKAIMEGRLNNDDLVVFLNETIQPFLNPVSPSSYARQRGISPQGALKNKNLKVIFGKKFIIDNQ